jgi:hypothetical protein
VPDATVAASPDAGFARADLTTFCRLDELGLEVTGQRLEPDRAVLACRVLEPDKRCRRCGCEGTVRDTVMPVPRRSARVVQRFRGPAATRRHSGLLETSRRIGVRPDSVQVLGGTLYFGLPTCLRVWLYFGLRAVGRRD